MYIFFIFAWLGLHCCTGFSLVVVRRGYSQFWGTGFSLQWLPFWWGTGCRAPGPQYMHVGSGADVPRLSSCGLGLSCSVACGIVPVQASNPSPALAGGFFTTEPPGKSSFCFLKAHVVTVHNFYLLLYQFW